MARQDRSKEHSGARMADGAGIQDTSSPFLPECRSRVQRFRQKDWTSPTGFRKATTVRARWPGDCFVMQSDSLWCEVRIHHGARYSEVQRLHYWSNSTTSPCAFGCRPLVEEYLVPSFPHITAHSRISDSEQDSRTRTCLDGRL